MPKEKQNTEIYLEQSEILRVLLSETKKEGFADDKKKSLEKTYKIFYRDGFASMLCNAIEKSNGKNFFNIIYEIGDEQAIKKALNTKFPLGEEQNKFNNLSKSEQINFLSNKFGKEISNLKLFETLKEFFSGDFTLEKGFQSKFLNSVSKNTSLSDDEFVPDAITISDPYHLSLEQNEDFIYNDTLNELKNEIQLDDATYSKDKKDKILEALEDCTHFLSVPKDASKNNGSTIAEAAGSYYSGAETKRLINELPDKGLISKENFVAIDTLTLSSRTTREEINELNQYARSLDGNNYFDEDTLNKFEDLYDYFDKNDLIAKNYNEEAYKYYSIRGLSNARDKLINAVKNKNIDDIVKYRSEFRNKEKIIDTALEKIHDLQVDERFFPNVSCSRTSGVPFKYRKDYVGVSNLNSLAFLFKAIKDSGIGIKTFLREPIKNYGQVNESVLNHIPSVMYIKKTPKGKLIRDGLVSVLEDQKDIADIELMSASTKYLGFERGLQTLPFFIKDKEKSFDLFKKLTICNHMCTQQQAEILISCMKGSIFYEHGKDNKDSMAMKYGSLFSYQPQKDSLLDIDVSTDAKFDRNTFKKIPNIDFNVRGAKLDNAPKFLLEVMDAVKYMREKKLIKSHIDNVLAGAEKFHTYIPRDKKTNSYDWTANFILEGNFDQIDKDDLINLKAEAEFIDIKGNGFTKENVVNGLIAAAKLKKAYENSGFFSKFTNASVVERNDIYGRMISDLGASGLTKEQLNNAVEILNSGIQNVESLVRASIEKELNPNVTKQYVEYKLKGATDKELRTLFATKEFLTEEGRKEYFDNLRYREAIVVGNISSCDKEIEKLQKIANSKSEKDPKKVERYTNAYIELAVLKKKMGIETDFKEFPFELSKDQLDLYGKAKMGEYTKPLNNLLEMKIPCSVGGDNEGNKSLNKIYDEIYAYRKAKNKSLDKNDVNKVLSNVSEDKDLLNKVGISYGDSDKVVLNIKKLKLYEKSAKIYNDEIDVKKDKVATLNRIVTADKSGEKDRKNANAQIQIVQQRKNEFVKELDDLNKDAAKYHSYMSLLYDLDKREKEQGSEFQNDLVVDYQRKLKAYDKLSPEQQEFCKSAFEEFDAYKNNFTILGVDVEGYNFTNAEKKIIKDNKQALVDLHNDKKAYDKTSGVSRFFSHFLPNSLTSLGRMRNKIAEKEKELNSLGLSSETIKHYDVALDVVTVRQNKVPHKQAMQVGENAKNSSINYLNKENGLEKSNVIQKESKDVKNNLQ